MPGRERATTTKQTFGRGPQAKPEGHVWAALPLSAASVVAERVFRGANLSLQGHGKTKPSRTARIE